MARLHLFLVFTAALVLSGAADAAAPPWRLVDRYGDPLPAGAVARLGTIRWRYYQGYYSPVLSPDGRWLVSKAFDEKGNRLNVNLWETSTGRVYATGVPPADDFSAFTDYAFLPGGKHLLSQTGSGKSYLWEIPSFRLIKRWEGKDPPGLTFSSTGELCAGFEEGSVRVFNFRTGKGRSIAIPRLSGWSLVFSPDGCLVILEKFTEAAGKPGEQRFGVISLDLITGRILRRFTINVEEAQLAPDGRHVAAVNSDWNLEVWRVDTGKRLPLESTPDELVWNTLAFSPDGRRLVATGFPPGGIRIYDLDRGLLLNRVRSRHSFEALAADQILVSPGCNLLYDTGVYISHHLSRVSLRTGRPADSLIGFSNPPQLLTWGPSGRFVGALDLYESTWWDAAGGRLVHRARLSDHGYSYVFNSWLASALAPHGKMLACCEMDKTHITLLDGYSGKVTQRLCGHAHEVIALAFSADGKRLVSADKAGQVRLWDVATGRSLHAYDFSKTGKRVNGLLFFPDGRKVVLIESSGQVHLWEPGSEPPLHILRPAEKQPWDESPLAAAISPAGDLLVVARSSGLRAWDLRSLRELGRFEGEEDPEATADPRPCLSFSADGRFLARVENGLTLYEVASGRIIHRFKGRCAAAAFHPSDLRLAAAHEERLDALIWDLKTLFSAAPITRPMTLPALWNSLLDRNASDAQRAAWGMATVPGMERFLAGELRPAVRLDPAWLDRQIGELASDRFLSRQKAEAALASVGEATEPALRSALRTTKDLEMRRRIERLLARLDPRSPTALRERRALLALEVRGTPEARHLLERLAAGLPGARLTEEATAALRRLRARP